MMTPFKWMLVSFIFAAIIVSAVYAANIQDKATKTTAEVEVIDDTLSVGNIRGEMNDNGISTAAYVSKEELVSDLVGKMVTVQKSHPYDIHLKYLFFDKDGKSTNEESKIRSIQIRMQYIDKKGKIRGTAERHLAINQLKN